MRGLSLMTALAIVWASIAAAPAAERAIAVFDFELVDTSLEGDMNGQRADEQDRLAHVTGQLRARLAESGRFSVVDTAPLASRLRTTNLQACGGCDSDFARQLGARLSITGWVQKVSNLILNMNVAVRDAETGHIVAGISVDMRGNTEESWSRALDWIVCNYLLASGQGLLR